MQVAEASSVALTATSYSENHSFMLAGLTKVCSEIDLIKQTVAKKQKNTGGSDNFCASFDVGAIRTCGPVAASQSEVSKPGS